MRAALIILLMLPGLVAGRAGAEERTVLTNAAQYWAMSPRQAGCAWRLRWEGVVTGMDASRDWLILQDATGALALTPGLKAVAVHPGQRVRVEADEAWAEVAAFPEFPGDPKGSMLLSAFEGPANWGRYYLDRIRGWLCPPSSGEYHFWIASKGSSELWLSTNEAPANAVRLAWVSRGSSTRPRQWTKYSSQASPAVWLEAGRRYYVESLHEHGAGGDHVEVGWQGPGQEPETIDGRYLSVAPGGWDLSPAGKLGDQTNGLLREHWTNFVLGSVGLLSARQPADAPLTARSPRLTVLGNGAWPEPRSIQAGQPIAEPENLRWSQCEGRVETLAVEGETLVLELAQEAGERLRVRVAGWGRGAPPLWRQAQVRASGVGVGRLDSSGRRLAAELWVPDKNLVELLETAEAYWSACALTPICALNPANPGVAWGRLTRARGTVLRANGPGEWLVQSEDSFVGAASRNGKDWTQVGQPIEVPMDEAIQAGLAVSSFDSNAQVTATFDAPRGVPEGAQGLDINSPGLPGKSVLDGTSYQVTGSGVGMGLAWDQFHFLSARLESDGELVAQVTGLKFATPRASAGLMMRNSMVPNSAFVDLALTATGGVSLLFRQSGSARGEAVAAPGYSAPCWLRLTRRHYQLAVRLEPPVALPLGAPVEVMGLLTWEKDQPVLLRARWRDLGAGEAPLANVVRARSGPPDLVPIEQVVSDAFDNSNAGSAAGLIRGVVTFHDLVSLTPVLAVQDETGAVFVKLPTRLQRYPLEPGQLLELECKRFNGKFPKPFEASAMAALGAGQFPKPLRYPSQFSLPHRGEGRWVELEGVVTAVNSEGLLMVRAKDDLVPVWLGQVNRSELGAYVDSLVRARGVMAWHLEPAPLLLVPSAGFLEILESRPADPFAVPAISTAELTELNDRSRPVRRVKVSGVVTARRQGVAFLQDRRGGVRVLMEGGNSLRVGEQAEAVGFSRSGPPDSPVLTGGLARAVGRGAEPPPALCPISELLVGRYNATLVQVHATLLEERKRRDEQVLELQSAQRVFRATLATESGSLANFRPGSLLELTGVCWSERGNSATPASTSPPETALASFELVLRSPADVVVVRQPPWWTWKHTAWTVAGMLVVLAGALVWIRLLHQRVAERTRDLEAAMGRLEKETKTSATLAERDRLAGEIHDGLEQGLSGIMMQLDGVEAKLSENPEQARHYLESARHMVRFSRAEVRHSLWNLQSPVLANADLATALAQIARQMSAGRETAVTVQVQGTAQPLPPATEHNFLRICQEVLNNALKHAHARTVQVELSYSDQEVRLRVSDDGLGFVPEQVMAGVAGHLGLRNLRTRARRMGGRLTIQSAPGQGARLEVVVPLNQPPPPS